MAGDAIKSVLIDVEVCIRGYNRRDSSEIEEAVEHYLHNQDELVLNKLIRDTILPEKVKYVRFCSNDTNKVNLNGTNVKKLYHIYTSWAVGPETDYLYQQNEQVPASIIWCLPNEAFEGLWESVILQPQVKDRLITYVQTTLSYSTKKVNSQIVHWNGIVLLHGYPGTGKTTLCKALAQKLSMRLGPKYKTCKLVEINSHSLFSKWFSESPKLVLKMFTTIKEWLQEMDHFVCILIDEVESLTQMRTAKGSEPSDSIRVVNTVLTQIDQLKRYQNFLILSTSNVPSIIDNAFSDRADLKLYLPYPSGLATYEIYTSCLEELIKCGLVRGNVNDFFDTDTYKKVGNNFNDNDDVVSEIMENTKLLSKACENSSRFSGRTLRKIPFLTSTKFVNDEVPTIKEFLNAMLGVIETQISDLDFYQNSS